MSVQRDQIPKIAKSPGAGAGVSAQRDQIPAVPSWLGGGGVSRQRETIAAGDGRLSAWFAELAARLARVIVLNRDWTAAVTPTVLADTASGPGASICRCVFLDPPYRSADERRIAYGADLFGETDAIASAAYQWAVRHGDRYRIAYCSHVGDFPVPDGWEALDRNFKGRRNDRDRAGDQIMFSPTCRRPQPDLLAGLDA